MYFWSNQIKKFKLIELVEPLQFILYDLSFLHKIFQTMKMLPKTFDQVWETILNDLFSTFQEVFKNDLVLLSPTTSKC